MFGMDGVELEFTDDAVEKIAELAIERSTGARGLRAILEDIMLDIMYEIPSRKDIVKCIINEKSVTDKTPPELIIGAHPKKRSRGSAETGIGA
jgi:ATP-dependent Clp protease ATP-binding subunit ClpX